MSSRSRTGSKGCGHSSRANRSRAGSHRSSVRATSTSDAYVREEVRGFFHPAATCAIGRVVDADARVLGYDNLYVADASIMPTIPRANTNLSTAAVAERVADLLRG